MGDFGAPGTFSGITISGGPNPSAFESLRASLQSEFTETTGGTSPTDSAASASASATTTSASGPSSTNSPTTFSTSILSSDGSPPPAATTSQSPTGTAADAASSTTGEAPTVSENDQCSGVSCNSGLQAAIAVPIVIATLLIFALIFFCVRRRRRRREAEPVSEKKQTPKKKWSRHLRVFSFDAELLMGGWRSSSNSVRSRQTGSVRSGETSEHRQTPSLHSVDEVAPPYRDAITTVHPPAPVGVTAPTPDPFPRPSSTATAPPPYAAALGTTSRQSHRATSPPLNPFADASPISPIGASPFNDPPEDASPTSASHLMMSRQSSLLRSINEDGGSTLAGSDAGSIREAQLGRNVSVMSGGRTIDNVREDNSN